MKVAAPGKLLLTGAYAVLEGAPAIVVAVDRLAIVDDASGAPSADVHALYDGATKLGLGSSAAVSAATAALAQARNGEDIEHDGVRRRIFVAARREHAATQGGGSGVDVAASVFGGVLRYELRGDDPGEPPTGGEAKVAPFALPSGLGFAVFFAGHSARTSDLLARVGQLRARDAARFSARLDALADAARGAASAVDAASFVSAARATARGLAALGDAADAPIVTAASAELAREAEGHGAAFLPSGAGGGDVHVWIGLGAPRDDFIARAARVGMRHLSMGVDARGVRLV